MEIVKQGNRALENSFFNELQKITGEEDYSELISSHAYYTDDNSCVKCKEKEQGENEAQEDSGEETKTYSIEIKPVEEMKQEGAGNPVHEQAAPAQPAQQAQVQPGQEARPHEEEEKEEVDLFNKIKEKLQEVQGDVDKMQAHMNQLTSMPEHKAAALRLADKLDKHGMFKVSDMIDVGLSKSAQAPGIRTQLAEIQRWVQAAWTEENDGQSNQDILDVYGPLLNDVKKWAADTELEGSAQKLNEMAKSLFDLNYKVGAAIKVEKAATWENLDNKGEGYYNSAAPLINAVVENAKALAKSPELANKQTQDQTQQNPTEQQSGTEAAYKEWARYFNDYKKLLGARSDNSDKGKELTNVDAKLKQYRATLPTLPVIRRPVYEEEISKLLGNVNTLKDHWRRVIDYNKENGVVIQSKALSLRMTKRAQDTVANTDPSTKDLSNEDLNYAPSTKKPGDKGKADKAAPAAKTKSRAWVGDVKAYQFMNRLYGKPGKDNADIRAIQRAIGVKDDGYWGQKSQAAAKKHEHVKMTTVNMDQAAKLTGGKVGVKSQDATTTQPATQPAAQQAPAQEAQQQQQQQQQQQPAYTKEDIAYQQLSDPAKQARYVRNWIWQNQNAIYRKEIIPYIKKKYGAGRNDSEAVAKFESDIQSATGGVKSVSQAADNVMLLVRRQQQQ